MAAAAELAFGSEVACSDGPCGILRRVVVDPGSRVITHLVVEPRHGAGAGRLVPLGLVTSADAPLQLSCGRSDFAQLDEADEKRLPVGADDAQAAVMAFPYVRPGGILFGQDHRPRPFTSDIVPVGEAEVRQGDRVYAADGAIGNVRGVVIADGDHELTHVLLEEGHVFDRKEVAIPSTAIARVDDGVVLELTTEQVRDLPPVEQRRLG